jgi:hypothetical protein
LICCSSGVVTGIGYDLRASARILRADDHLRRRDIRKLRHGQQEVTNRPCENHDDGYRRGEDRALNEEIHHRRPYPLMRVDFDAAAPRRLAGAATRADLPLLPVCLDKHIMLRRSIF